MIALPSSVCMQGKAQRGSEGYRAPQKTTKLREQCSVCSIHSVSNPGYPPNQAHPSASLCLLPPVWLLLQGNRQEFSTSSSSCSSMTRHWRRYGVSLAGFRERVSWCRALSIFSQMVSSSSSCSERLLAWTGTFSTARRIKGKDKMTRNDGGAQLEGMSRHWRT